MTEDSKWYLIELRDAIPLYVYEVLLSVFCLGVISFMALELKKAYRRITLLFLIEYIVLIYCSTLIFRGVNDIRKYNYHPFWSYSDTSLFVENVMNIVVFVPIGLLLAMGISRLKWWHVLLIGAGISVSIEALQFVFRKGFSEVDDLIHNILGCLLGYGAYRMVAWFIRNIRTLGYSE